MSNPTLTVFPAEPSKANGTAVVICPGGAFFGHSIDSEGFDVAHWLKPGLDRREEAGGVASLLQRRTWLRHVEAVVEDQITDARPKFYRMRVFDQ